jgi:hypothetical protein
MASTARSTTRERFIIEISSYSINQSVTKVRQAAIILTPAGRTGIFFSRREALAGRGEEMSGKVSDLLPCAVTGPVAWRHRLLRAGKSLDRGCDKVRRLPNQLRRHRPHQSFP